MDTCLKLRQIPQDFVGSENENDKKGEKISSYAYE